ncbi:MAG TPA: hypothetical protein VJ964_06960 [Balneolaceae bacterium]|nr:hypothetical protein [Balneolaceae bacterium]
MDNLNDMGIISLKINELQTIDGGVLIGNFSSDMIMFFQWAYTEYKKGLDDGLNGN